MRALIGLACAIFLIVFVSPVFTGLFGIFGHVWIFALPVSVLVYWGVARWTVVWGMALVSIGEMLYGWHAGILSLSFLAVTVLLIVLGRRIRITQAVVRGRATIPGVIGAAGLCTIFGILFQVMSAAVDFAVYRAPITFSRIWLLHYPLQTVLVWSVTSVLVVFALHLLSRRISGHNDSS